MARRSSGRERFIRLLETARPLFKGADSAHDIGHAMRVLRLAELLGEAEGADLDILRPAALLHDIGCAPKHLGKEHESEGRTLKIARSLLLDNGYPKATTEAILGIIKVHGYSRGIIPRTLEGKLLQDADRLDAMGAIGIARCFLVGGSTNRPMYDLEDPWAKCRGLDDKAFGLDHFFRKLVRLKEGMHSRTAKKMAEERHRFLEAYLVQLRRELGD
jgi:uncharacterized protein